MSTTTSRKRFSGPRAVRVFASLVLAGSVMSCSNDDTTRSDATPEGTEALQNVLAARESLARRYDPGIKDIADLVPAKKFKQLDGTQDGMSDQVIVGAVVDVSEGQGFRDVGPDGAESEMVAYDDASATWKTLHLTVEVTERLAGEDEASTVEVGMALSGGDDGAAVAEALMSTDGVMMFLNADSAVFSYDPNLSAIAWNGWGLVTAIDDQVDVPAIADRAEEAKFLAGSRSLEQLRKLIKESESGAA